MEPNAGPPGTIFRFRVKYRDHEGQRPLTSFMRVWRDDNMVGEYAMNTTGANFKGGAIYGKSIRISTPGTYKYQFFFGDSDGPATGAPTNRQAGPVLTPSSAPAVAVTSLCAAPTASGAQVTFHLRQQAPVTVTIRNLGGRTLRTLRVDRPLAARMNTLVWDRRNDQGARVPAGSYVVTVEAQGQNGTRAVAVAALLLP